MKFLIRFKKLAIVCSFWWVRTKAYPTPPFRTGTPHEPPP
jgi:hypothetical protein